MIVEIKNKQQDELNTYSDRVENIKDRQQKEVKHLCEVCIKDCLEPDEEVVYGGILKSLSGAKWNKYNTQTYLESTFGNWHDDIDSLRDELAKYRVWLLSEIKKEYRPGSVAHQTQQVEAALKEETISKIKARSQSQGAVLRADHRDFESSFLKRKDDMLSRIDSLKGVRQ